MMGTIQIKKDSYVSFSLIDIQSLRRQVKMKRLAFKVKVFESRQDEFKRLYQDMAPELINTIEKYGIKKLAVYLDESTSEVTCTLFYPEQLELETFLSEEPILLWRLIANTLMDIDEKGLPIIVFLSELYYHDPVENY